MKEDRLLMKTAAEHFKLYAHTVLCLNTENKTNYLCKNMSNLTCNRTVFTFFLFYDL